MSFFSGIVDGRDHFRLGGYPGAQLVTQGLPAWDSAIVGAAGHGNLLFYSS